MSSEVEWTTVVVTKAQQHNPTAPDALWAQFGTLLKEKLSDKQLSPGELTTVAKQLVATMASVPSKDKAE